MLPNRETLLCRYFYDPLDWLVGSTTTVEGTIQRFYLKDRLATEIQGAVQCSIMQHEDQLLAQQQHQRGILDTGLLATDQQRSVLNVLNATRPHPLAYSPYGHRPAGNGLISLLGFNGERPDQVTGCFLLGNGYRAFNPVLMRFNSPDSWSPFGEGGLNAYGYTDGDPINRSDPTGHSPFRPPRMVNKLAKISSNSKAISKQANNMAARNSLLNNTKMNNLTPLRDGIFGFTDFDRGKNKRLTIMGHGIEDTNGNYEILSKHGNLSSHELSAILNSVTKEYKYIRLAICNSATGENPIASQIAASTGKPTLGYIGNIAGAPSLEYLQNLFNTNSRTIEHKKMELFFTMKDLRLLVKTPLLLVHHYIKNFSTLLLRITPD